MVMMRAETAEERKEKAEAALKQLLICARAECGSCTLVPEPEEYRQCLQVIDTCREILREALGLQDDPAGDGIIRATDEDTSADRSVYARSGAVSSRSEVEEKEEGDEDGEKAE